MERALSQLKAVGPKRMEALQAAGIDTVRQLLCRLPVDYRDMSRVTPLAQLRPGQAAVWVRLLGRVQAGYFRGLHITAAAWRTKAARWRRCGTTSPG